MVRGGEGEGNAAIWQRRRQRWPEATAAAAAARRLHADNS